MARKNYAPPTGFVMEPAQPAPVATPAPAQTAAPAAPALPPPPAGFELQDAPAAPRQAVTAIQMGDDPNGAWTDIPQADGQTGKELEVDVTGGASPDLPTPTSDPVEFKKTLDGMVASKASAQDIRSYIEQHGSSVPEGAEQYLQAYEQNQGNNPDDPGKPFYIPWTVTPKPAEVGRGEATWEGIKHGALMGAGDEIQAFGGGVGSLISGRGFQSGYDEELAAARGTDEQAWQQHPGFYGTGTAVGFVPGLALPGGRVAQIESRLDRTAALGGVGGLYGAINGAASADADRLGGAERGAIGGAIGGVVLPPVLTLGGNVAGRIGEKLGVNALASRGWSGLEALLARAPQDVDAIAGRVAERRAAGLDPSLAHVLDEQGAGTLRAAGQRGDARTTAAAFGRDSRADLPDVVARQAAPISPVSRPTAEVIAETEARRTAAADTNYEAIRNTTVPVTDDLKKILDTGAGRKALKNAIESSDSPDEVAGFLSGLKRSNEPSELNRMMALLPEGMNQAARAQIRTQLEAQGVKGSDPMPEFTLDMLDRVKRGLQARAKSPDASGESRQLRIMANKLIEHGDSAAPGYAAARGEFAADSRLVEAAELGAGISKGNPDEFIADAGRLGDEGRKITTTLPAREAEGNVQLQEMGPDAPMTHQGNYETPDGRYIDLEVTKHGDGTATVDIPGSVADANSFGPRVIRDMMTALHEADPSIKYVIGERTTGAREARGIWNAGNDTGVSIEPRARTKTTTLPSERDLARMGARRSVELAAQESPRSALGVADRLAYGRNALNRLDALVGPETAGQVQRGMGLAATDARRATFLDPNAGSKTASLASDMGASAIDFGINAMSGKAGVIRAVAKWANNAGIRDIDATRLWDLAADPRRTDEALAYLRTKVDDPALARRVVDSIRKNIPGFVGRESGAAQDDNRPQRGGELVMQ